MSIGETAVKLTHAHAYGKPFPADVEQTPENLELWHSIRSDVAKMPHGMVVEAPWDYTLDDDDTGGRSMALIEYSVSQPLDQRAAAGRIHHFSGKWLPLDAKNLEDRNPHPPGTLHHVNFAKAFHQGAQEADRMNDRRLSAEIDKTVNAFSKATKSSELATHEGRLSALRNEQAFRQKLADEQAEQVKRQNEQYQVAQQQAAKLNALKGKPNANPTDVVAGPSVSKPPAPHDDFGTPERTASWPVWTRSFSPALDYRADRVYNWKHGWIPLTPAAVAIKLKYLQGHAADQTMAGTHEALMRNQHYRESAEEGYKYGSKMLRRGQTPEQLHSMAERYEKNVESSVNRGSMRSALSYAGSAGGIRARAVQEQEKQAKIAEKARRAAEKAGQTGPQQEGEVRKTGDGNYSIMSRGKEITLTHVPGVGKLTDKQATLALQQVHELHLTHGNAPNIKVVNNAYHHTGRNTAAYVIVGDNSTIHLVGKRVFNTSQTPEPGKSYYPKGFVMPEATNHLGSSEPNTPEQTARYLISHEYGHTMDNLRSGSSGTSPSMRAAYSDIMKRHKAGEATGLSEYGRSQPAEAYAETFAEWHMSGGKTTSPAAQHFARLYGWNTPGEPTVTKEAAGRQVALATNPYEPGTKEYVEHMQSHREASQVNPYDVGDRNFRHFQTGYQSGQMYQGYAGTSRMADELEADLKAGKYDSSPTTKAGMEGRLAALRKTTPETPSQETGGIPNEVAQRLAKQVNPYSPNSPQYETFNQQYGQAVAANPLPPTDPNFAHFNEGYMQGTTYPGDRQTEIARLEKLLTTTGSPSALATIRGKLAALQANA